MTTNHVRACRGCGRKLRTTVAGSGRPRIRCARCKTKEHRQRNLARIRASDPVYAELEKRAVRKRMRIRRAALHALGLTNRGTKPKKSHTAAKALTGRYRVPPFAPSREVRPSTTGAAAACPPQ